MGGGTWRWWRWGNWGLRIRGGLNCDLGDWRDLCDDGGEGAGLAAWLVKWGRVCMAAEVISGGEAFDPLGLFDYLVQLAPCSSAGD